MTGHDSQELLIHYRGLVAVRNRGLHTRYLDVGSKRFMSVPARTGSASFLTLLFVYGGEQDQEVLLVDARSRQRKPWRIYIKSAFPYLGFLSSKGAYKTLYVAFGLGLIQNLVVRRGSKQIEVFQCAEVQEDDLLSSFHDISAKLEDLVDTERSQSSDQLARLERSILALDPTLKSQKAQQAAITLYCLYLRNHRNAHKLLKSWTEAQRAEGLPDAIPAFQEKLDRITFPLGLGRHGFNPSFKNLDLDAVEEELHKLMADLSRFDVQPFLNSGTLLGYYRDGRPIPHDDDFDLGVLVSGNSEEEVALNWRQFVKAVGAKYDVIDKGSFVALKLSNGVQVDLFCAWTLDRALYVHPYCWADTGENALLPMQVHPVRGRDFNIPADPDAVLTVNYGENWREPDPFWRFDYKKSKRRFGAFLKKLKTPA